jgi:hypothetical protein
MKNEEIIHNSFIVYITNRTVEFPEIHMVSLDTVYWRRADTLCT